MTGAAGGGTPSAPARRPVAVILARGLGTRMRAPAPAPTDAALSDAQAAAADAGLKALMPLHGAPLVDHLLSRLADAGVDEAILVVPPGDSPLRAWCEAPRPGGRRVRVRFAVQPEPRGTADACAVAIEAVGDRDALVLNGDNLYPVPALRLLATLTGAGLVAFPAFALTQGNVPADRVRAFARVEVAEDGTLTAITEKPPAMRPSDLVSMNCWRFPPAVLACCARTVPSPRGEHELPDAVRLAMAEGTGFRVLPCLRPVLDCSSRADINPLEAALAGEVPRP